jgi:hypothetical protein
VLSRGEPLHAQLPGAQPALLGDLAKSLLLDALQTHHFDGLDVSGEATGYFWLPFFLQLAADLDLEPYDLNLFLLNPRWVKWFKKCFAQDNKCDHKNLIFRKAWRGYRTASGRFFSNCHPTGI